MKISFLAFLLAASVSVLAGVPDELIALADAGVSSEVLSAWAQRQHGYSLSADDIIRLRDHKIPDSVLAVVIKNSGRMLASRPRPPATEEQPAPAPLAEAPQTQAEAAPAPEVSYVSPSYTDTRCLFDPYYYYSDIYVASSYPLYAYSPYYYPYSYSAFYPGFGLWYWGHHRHFYYGLGLGFGGFWGGAYFVDNFGYWHHYDHGRFHHRNHYYVDHRGRSHAYSRPARTSGYTSRRAGAGVAHTGTARAPRSEARIGNRGITARNLTGTRHFSTTDTLRRSTGRTHPRATARDGTYTPSHRSAGVQRAPGRTYPRSYTAPRSTQSRSYTAPRGASPRNYTAPRSTYSRSYSTPRAPGYSRSYAPRSSSYSAPRSSSSFSSRGHSGGGGGFRSSGGGGGHRR